MDNTNEILTRVTNKIEQECDIKNAAFLLSLILMCIDPKTWVVDKSYLTRLYHAIDIVEKDEELKKLYGKDSNGK
jgi:hypothetical protein